MGDRPKKTVSFYAEMVSITVLSLVSASIWVELVKGTIAKLANNNPYILLLAAMITTIAAVYGLSFMWCEVNHHHHNNGISVLPVCSFVLFSCDVST